MSTQQWPFFLILHYFSSLIMSLGFKTQMRKKCARASCPTPSPALQMRNLNSFLFFSSKRDLSMCTWTNESWKCEKVCFFGQYFDFHSDQENLIVNYTKNLLSWVREKKSESFSWKPIQCVVKILPKLSPKKVTKNENSGH